MKTIKYLLILVLLNVFSIDAFSIDYYEEIKVGDFSYYLTLDNNLAVCSLNTSKAEVTIPETIELEGNKYNVCSLFLYCFCHEHSLKSITFPSTLKEIGAGAFADCPSLEKVVIPDGLVSIGFKVFKDCPNLKSITLPSTLSFLDNGAFLGCNNLQTIILKVKKPFVISDTAFEEKVFKKARLIVPAGTKKSYTNMKGWDLFENIEEETTGIEEVKNANSNRNNSSLYNLSGQKVSDSYKGIVIKKGKKIIK